MLPKSSSTVISKVEVGDDALVINICEVLKVTNDEVGFAFTFSLFIGYEMICSGSYFITRFITKSLLFSLIVIFQFGLYPQIFSKTSFDVFDFVYSLAYSGTLALKLSLAC